MAIVTYEQLAAQVGLTDDAPEQDQTALQQKADAAQNHIERLLGYRIVDQFPDETPPALVEAVLQLAAWWFENREAASESDRVLPFGVAEIVNEYREWSF